MSFKLISKVLLLASIIRLWFDLLNVFDDLLNLFFLCAPDYVSGTVSLVGSNEIRVIDSGEWKHGFHVRPQLLLQIDVKHLCPGHGISQVHVADIPSPKHNVVRVNLPTDLFQEYKLSLLP